MGTWMLLTGITVATLGKVLLGITVLIVHGKISEEHSIDSKVLTELKHEKILGLIGVALMIIGYIFEMAFYLVGPGAAF